MDKTEYCEFVSRYRKQLYVVAYAILKNEMDAEDAVCNGILRGYENLDQLRDSRKLKSWMTVITKNEALKIREKRALMPGDEKLEELLEPVQDRHDELWDIVQKLKEEYRLVVVLFYYNEMSLKEISRILEIPVGTVKSRLNRAREFLKKELDDWEGNIYENR